MTWLTVITVVKDDHEGFARSLTSLLTQDRSGVQWVVIDSSNDREFVVEQVGSSDVAGLVRWEPARGIYAAMNAGLELADGEFAFFLNAGDVFAAADVLTRARRLLGGETWGFGPVRIVESSGRSVVTPQWNYQREKSRWFSRGLFPSHQGTFARTQTLRDLGGFDTSYAVAGDYAMFLRLSRAQDPVLLPFVIADFHEGGTSTREWKRSFAEFHRARREILQLAGVAALREQWETIRHFGLVYAHREIRPRLGLRTR